MAAPIKKIIHRFIHDINEYEIGGSQVNKIIPLDTQVFAYYPDTYLGHLSGLYFVLGDGVHTYKELRAGLGIYPTAKEYSATGDSGAIDELRRLIETKVTKNPEAVEGTGIKVTTDENGLVIGIEDLGVDDIPALPTTKIDGVTVTSAEINQLSGATSNIQDQLDTLTTNLSSEVATRTSEDIAIRTSITNEETARANADTALSERIDTLDTGVVKYDEDQGVVNTQSITLEGINGTKITNLKSGDLTANSTDAVTGSQLKVVADDLDDLAEIVEGKQSQLTSANAGEGIEITGEGANIVIKNTRVSAEWGNITGDITDQTDLQTAVTYSDTDGATVAVGGWAIGNKANKMSFQDFAYKLLHPYIKPTVTISLSPSDMREIGNTLDSITITTVVTKKAVDELTKVNFYYDNGITASKLIESKTTGVATGGTFSYTYTPSTPIGTTTNKKRFYQYYTTAAFDEVTTAGVSANTYLTFVARTYYGVSNAIPAAEADVEALGFNKLSNASSEVYNNILANNQYIIYATPFVVTKIVDGNGFTLTESFDKKTISVKNAYNVTTSYNVYYLKQPTTCNGDKLTFTITTSTG